MTNDEMTLRNKLVDIALDWQENFGVAPSITSAISEYDAAMLIGMPESEYSDYMQDKTAVSKFPRVIGTGTLVRYLSRICGTFPYDSVVPVPMIRVFIFLYLIVVLEYCQLFLSSVT